MAKNITFAFEDYLMGIITLVSSLTCVHWTMCYVFKTKYFFTNFVECKNKQWFLIYEVLPSHHHHSHHHHFHFFGLTFVVKYSYPFSKFNDYSDNSIYEVVIASIRELYILYVKNMNFRVLKVFIYLCTYQKYNGRY